MSISFTTGTDAAPASRRGGCREPPAALSGGSCGSWSGFADIGAVGPTSPYVDGSLAIACYKYRYVVTDRVGNQDVATSGSVVKVGYGGGIASTPGLLAHWRLSNGPADPYTGSSSWFTDHSGKLLAHRRGARRLDGGAGHHREHRASATRARIFKATAGYSVDQNSLVQATPDYTVEADLVHKSVLTDDAMGVIGRYNTSSNTFYLASWEERDNSWNLALVTNGTIDYLDYVLNQPALVTGQTYHLKLEMVGSALKLLRQRGAQGLGHRHHAHGCWPGRHHDRPGRHHRRARLNATGLHLDNFQVSTTSRALDSKGDNHGAYVNGVTRGVAGALPSDSDTAASFDGVNDYVQVLNPTGIPVGWSRSRGRSRRGSRRPARPAR